MAVQTLDQMATKGKKALDRKAPTMKAGYDAAKADMKTSFNALPFGTLTKRAYDAGIDDAEYRTPDTDKWARNWRRKVAR